MPLPPTKIIVIVGAWHRRRRHGVRKHRLFAKGCGLIREKERIDLMGGCGLAMFVMMDRDWTRRTSQNLMGCFRKDLSPGEGCGWRAHTQLEIFYNYYL